MNGCYLLFKEADAGYMTAVFAGIEYSLLRDRKEKKIPVNSIPERTQFILVHSDHVFLSRSTSVRLAFLNMISFLGKKYPKVNPSANKYKARATPRYKRMEGDVFQNSASAIIPSAWFTGENMRKKFPGLTDLKYSLATAIELGRSVPQDLESIKEVYRLANRRPLATVIDANRIIFFMIFFCKDGFRPKQKIVFNGHSHKYAPLQSPYRLCILRESSRCTS